MIFDALTIGQLRGKIKDLPDDMPIYLDCEDEYGCMGALSIEQRTLYDLDTDKETAIEALVLGVA